MITSQNDVSQMYQGMNPLATQFMTGGQMEYMPSAQFLTSSQYGAFRTTPSYAEDHRVVQNPTLWQSYLQANRGRVLGMGSDYFVNNYLPQVNQYKHQALAQRRVSDAGSAFGGAATDMFGGMAGSAIGAALTMGNPVGAFVGGMIMPSIAAPYMDRIRQSRDMQQVSMSKIIGGPDVSKGLRQGFSMSASMGIEENIKKSAITDRLFNEEDLRKIQKLGMEAGLYDFEGTERDYKKALTVLKKHVKFAQGMLETSDLGEVMKDLKRLQRMGMSKGTFMDVASLENTYGRMAGLNHEQMINTYGQQGALTFSQNGLTGYQGSLESMAAAGRIEMKKRLHMITESELARRGGVSGMAQTETQNTATSINRIRDFILPALAKQGKDGNVDYSNLDVNAIKDMMTGKMTLRDAMGVTSDRISRGPKEILNYEANKDEATKQLMDQLGPEGFKLLEYQTAKQEGARMGYTTLKEQLTAGYEVVNGLKPDEARLRAEEWTNPEYLKNIQEQISQGERTRKNQAYSERKQDNTVWNRLGEKFSSAMYNIGGKAYASYAADQAIEKDREENEKLGIANTQVYGISLGEAGYTDADKKKLALSGVTESVAMFEKDRYKKMVDFWDNPTGSSNIANQASKYSNADKFLQSKDMSEDELASAKKGLADSASGLTVRDIEQISTHLEGIGDLTDSNLSDELTTRVQEKNPKLSKLDAMQQAHSLLQQSSVKKLLLHNMAVSDSKRFTSIQDTMSEKNYEVDKEQADSVINQWKNIHDQLGELTHQGLFGTNDPEALKTYKKAIGHSGKALHAITAAASLNSLTEEGISDDEKRKRMEVFKQSWIRLGGDPKKLKELIDGGAGDAELRNALQDLLTDKEKIGMDKELASDLIKDGYASGEGEDSTDLALKASRANRLERDIYSTNTRAKSANMFSMLEDEFADAKVDMATGLTNEASVQAVIDNIGDNPNKEKERKFLTSLRDGIHNGVIKTKSDITQNLGAELSGVIDVSKVDKTSDPKGSKETTQVLQDSLSSISASLVPALNNQTQVLDNIGVLVGKNSNTLEKVDQTLLKLQRG